MVTVCPPFLTVVGGTSSALGVHCICWRQRLCLCRVDAHDDKAKRAYCASHHCSIRHCSIRFAQDACGDAEGLLSTEGEIKVAKLLVLAGLAASAGEATRKLAENAVSVNGEKFTGKVLGREALGEGTALRLGKKSVRLEWMGR